MELEKWSSSSYTYPDKIIPSVPTTGGQGICMEESYLRKRDLRKSGMFGSTDLHKRSKRNELPTAPTTNSSDEGREEDEWLYGEGDSSSKPDPVNSGEPNNKERRPSVDDQQLNSENGDKEGIPKDAAESVPAATGEGEETAEGANNTQLSDKEGESEEDDEEDDSSDDDDDDGVKVVIGDIKSTTGQSPFGVGASGVKRPAPPPDKKGKFAVEDFETPGTINGVSALEFNIDGVEDKPWRKPGADITDYFNYGFTEETWKAYSDRQKRMRFEAGGPQISNPTGKQDSRGVITVAFGQAQGQRSEMIRRREEPRENTIQVMTADRREYSRKNFEMGHPLAPPFDMSVPPPNFSGPPPGQDFMPNPEFFNHPPPQYQGYDEHQGYEEQWMDHHTWDMEGMRGPPPGGPSSIVSLTKVSNVPPPPGDEDTGIKDERNN